MLREIFEEVRSLATQAAALQEVCESECKRLRSLMKEQFSSTPVEIEWNGTHLRPSEEITDALRAAIKGGGNNVFACRCMYDVLMIRFSHYATVPRMVVLAYKIGFLTAINMGGVPGAAVEFFRANSLHEFAVYFEAPAITKKRKRLLELCRNGMAPRSDSVVTVPDMA
ncbi:MAG: hypothetical protein P1U53_14095 [Sulfitobacter sp.]|nr:hypothetical protein [Sulfitobacter sp.]